MKKPRVYISGPISGHNQQECWLKFQIVEDMLHEKNFEPFNPMKNGLPFEASTHEHMHRDLAELTNEKDPFSAIYMMRGWTHSKGCKVEFDVATAMGLKVFLEEAGTFITFT